MGLTKFATLVVENGVATLQDEMEIDLNLVPSKDPLAFMFGFSYGQRCVKERAKNHSIVVNHGSKFSELASEYIRGFLFGYRGILVPEGTKIKKGQEQNFALLQLNTYKTNKE